MIAIPTTRLAPVQLGEVVTGAYLGYQGHAGCLLRCLHELSQSTSCKTGSSPIHFDREISWHVSATDVAALIFLVI